MTETALATVPPQPAQDISLHYEWSMEQVIARVAKVREVMQRVMKEGDHYGKVPGTDKPSLLKPGAELLCLVFRLDPQYESVEGYEGRPTGDAHLTVKSRCTLWHVPTGQRLGSGEGSCSSKESKYAYRNAKRKCPKCGAEQINKSKFPPKGQPDAEPGWYCYAKTGGCGAEFAANAADIVEQQVGRVPNEDIADQYNTVLKMANKRSLIAAVLNVTAASEIFTQDVEDMPAEQLQNGRQSSHAPQAQQQEQERREPRQNPDNVITEPQRKRMWAIAKEHAWSEDDLRRLATVYHYESLRDIRAKDYDLMVNDIKRGPGALADGNAA